jgi:hypothetical protein
MTDSRAAEDDQFEFTLKRSRLVRAEINGGSDAVH